LRSITGTGGKRLAPWKSAIVPSFTR